MKKTIIIAYTCLIAFCILGCSEDDGVILANQKTNYSFSVSAVDNTPYVATITWGVNDLNLNQKVNSYGFGSSVELGDGESLLLRIDTAEDLYLTVTIDNEPMPKQQVTSGQVVVFDK